MEATYIQYVLYFPQIVFPLISGFTITANVCFKSNDFIILYSDNRMFSWAWNTYLSSQGQMPEECLCVKIFLCDVRYHIQK